MPGRVLFLPGSQGVSVSDLHMSRYSSQKFEFGDWANLE